MNKFKYSTCLYILIAIAVSFSTALLYFYFAAPIQPDEITTLYNNSRYFVDNGAYVLHYRTCLDAPIDIPALLHPIAIINSLYSYVQNSNLLRTIGAIPYAFLCLSLGFFVSTRVPTKKREAFFYVICLALILFFFTGSAIWNFTVRAEHQLILAVSLLIFTYSLVRRDTVSGIGLKAFYGFVILIWLSACYQHPKSIYFAPLFFIVALSLKFRVPTLLLGTSVVGSIIASIIKFNYARFAECNDNQFFSTWLKQTSINPANLVLDPKRYIYEFGQGWNVHWANIFDRAANNIAYAAQPDINYLPQVDPVGYSVNIANVLIKLFYYFELHLAVLSLLVLFFILLVAVSRAKFDLSAAKLYASEILNKVASKCSLFITDILFVLTLLFVTITILLHNRTNNSYDVQLWHILLSASFIMLVCPRLLSCSNYLAKLAILASLSVFAAISLNVAHRYYYKAFVGSWGSGTFAGPNLPVRMLERDVQTKIVGLYESCKRSDTGLLIVDDRTYFPLRNIGNIGLVTYMMLPAYFGREKDEGFRVFNNYMKKHENSVFIGACAYKHELPASMKVFKRDDALDICCYEFKN